MLFGKVLSNPNNCDCLESRCISEQLTEMSVIGSLKLILDQNP